MNRYFLLLVALLFSTSVFAATVSMDAVVDLRDVVQKSPEIAKMKQDLRKQFEPQQNKIQKMSKALSGDVDKLNREGDVTMSKTERNALKTKINDESKKLRAMQMDLREKVYEAQNKKMNSILSKIEDKVKQVAKKQNYRFVFLKSAVAYARSDVPDITEAVKSQ